MVDQSRTPTISVVMSVYNGEAFVSRSIESILNQTYRDFEFIIIDDGSTDQTPQILADYEQSDERIRIITNDPNIGLTKSLNLAIKHAKGEFIARQDADDMSYLHRFESQIKAFQQNPELALVTSHLDKLNTQGQKSRYQHAETDLMRRWLMLFYNHISGHTGVMLKTQILRELNGYDELFRYAQDYDLWARLVQDHTFAVIPEPLFCVHFHDGNISTQKLSEQDAYALKVSQRILAQLGVPLPLNQVENLQYFWRYQYEDITNFPQTNRDLRKIWCKFSVKFDVPPAEEETIKQWIAQRFWIAAFRYKLFSRWRGTLIALQWAPHLTMYKLLAIVKSKLLRH